MRDVIQRSLGRALARLPEEDRLAAALPVVCGATMASHCEVICLDESRALHLKADSPDWLRALLSMRERLRAELERVAGVPVRAVHCKEQR